MERSELKDTRRPQVAALLPPERSTVPGEQFRLLVDGALQSLHAAASIPLLNDIGQALERGCSAACVKRYGWQKTKAISGGGHVR